MITPDAARGRHSEPWQQWVAAERVIRQQYLDSVTAAARYFNLADPADYLTYRRVEAAAFDAYFEAGRQAWARYKQHLFNAPDYLDSLLTNSVAAIDGSHREPPTGPQPALPTFTPHTKGTD